MKCRPIIIIRATQKKMMSKPVTSVVGRIEALELRRLVRPAEGRERPQRRGEPGVEHVLVALERLGEPRRDRPSRPSPRLRSERRAQRRRRAPRRRPPPPSPRHRPRPRARTRPGSDVPTRAGATRTTAGCSRASRSRSSPRSSARTGSGPRGPRRAPAPASVLASTYH